jgi:hypothetical protein
MHHNFMIKKKRCVTIIYLSITGVFLYRFMISKYLYLFTVLVINKFVRQIMRLDINLILLIQIVI